MGNEFNALVKKSAGPFSDEAIRRGIERRGDIIPMEDGQLRGICSWVRSQVGERLGALHPRPADPSQVVSLDMLLDEVAQAHPRTLRVVAKNTSALTNEIMEEHLRSQGKVMLGSEQGRTRFLSAVRQELFETHTKLRAPSATGVSLIRITYEDLNEAIGRALASGRSRDVRILTAEEMERLRVEGGVWLAGDSIPDDVISTAIQEVCRQHQVSDAVQRKLNLPSIFRDVRLVLRDIPVAARGDIEQAVYRVGIRRGWAEETEAYKGQVARQRIGGAKTRS